MVTIALVVGTVVILGVVCGVMIAETAKKKVHSSK
jgi:hypothetical protein